MTKKDAERAVLEAARKWKACYPPPDGMTAPASHRLWHAVKDLEQAGKRSS